MSVSVGLIVFSLICGVIATVIGSAKNRSAVNWFLLGALFAPSVLIVAVLPKLPPRPPRGMRSVRYEIRTTALPAGAYGVDWRGFFNDQLKSPPIIAYHDGNKITVACHPDDEPEWLEKVDAAIEYANERLKSLYG